MKRLLTKLSDDSAILFVVLIYALPWMIAGIICALAVAGVWGGLLYLLRNQ